MKRADTDEVIGTGLAARLCGVSTHTLIKWIDSGLLRGYRIPGSKWRRIEKRNLAEFILKNGMPVPSELAEYAAEVAK